MKDRPTERVYILVAGGFVLFISGLIFLNSLIRDLGILSALVGVGLILDRKYALGKICILSIIVGIMFIWWGISTLFISNIIIGCISLFIGLMAILAKIFKGKKIRI